LLTRNDDSAPNQEPLRREDAALERIAAIVGGRDVPLGEVHIGDDAAILAPFTGPFVVSTDAAVRGVHLDAALFSLEDLGYKAVAAALSDLAAMGATPRAALVAVVAPPGTDLDALHRGVAAAAAEADCPIVGGDLSSGHDVVVTVTVLGAVAGAPAVTRAGARAGDAVMVTGPLGSAAAGLRLRRGGAGLNDSRVLVQRRPKPRIAEGVAAKEAGATAMMDLSDGLALDLHRLADASGVGFALATVPVAAGATKAEALSGGEDYELVIVAADADRVREAFASRALAVPIEIGVIVADPTTRTLSGAPLVRAGFEHPL
jgi:thiamine-monophosphate kinase